VLTIREEESVAEAVRIMAAHDVGCLVVMDSAAQHVTGIVTERVYSREIILKGRDSDLTPVGDVMKTDVVFVHIEEKLGDIAQVLSAHGVRHLPVLEGDVGSSSESAVTGDHVRRLHTPAAQLKGVLSIKDVCWMLFCLVRNELQGRGIGTMTVLDVLEGHHHRKVPYTIQKGASVLEAIEKMAGTDAHALCVLDDNGGLLGIVTEVRGADLEAGDAMTSID
jgi:CBS domain-containing protein